MKKLVLGALVAVASSTGCSSDPVNPGPPITDSQITVSWSFTHLADGSVRSCPTGFGTASVISQTIDPATNRGTGLKIVDKFDCAAGRGTITLPDDTYLVWVEITNTSGSSLYAASGDTFVDSTLGDDAFSVKILDDGGYFELSWDLLRATSGALLTCSQAGVGANGAVVLHTAGAGMAQDDKFTCEDHFGTTSPLLAGTYSIAIDAEDGNQQALGDTLQINDKTIAAPNKLTDLGNLMIPID